MAKRRANREGSIYQRQDGRWCAQMCANGRRLYHYAQTQAQARDWLLDMRKKASDGILLDVSGVTAGEYLQRWLSTVRASLRPKTVLQYEQVVRLHITPLLGMLRLRDLRPDQVQTLYARLTESGCSARLVQLTHAVLHRALTQAVRWQLLARNPADGVERPRVARREMHALTLDQVTRLLAAVRGTRWEALYHLAVYAGLRQGELLALRWSDINWQAGLVSIQRQVQQVTGHGTLFSEPKSARSRRVVALGMETLGVLRAQRDRVAELRLLAGSRWQEQDLLFPSTVGTPVGARNLVRHFVSVLAKTGLPHVRFHDLRHTSATLLLAEGVHPKLVQERLGHSQIGLTMDTYSHVITPLAGGVPAIVDALVRRGLTDVRQ